MDLEDDDNDNTKGCNIIKGGNDTKGVDESNDDDDKKFEGSSSNTGSSDEQIADPFSILELRDSVDKFNSIVGTVNAKVGSLVSKIDLVIKSLSKIKVVVPYELDRANQLDQLISLRLKHTLEEDEQRDKVNINHHISTTSTMLNINDVLIFATNELIKYTHIHHEKQIQRLE
ncbi:unnamed protein product [Lactuca saligna]|uniref:Uncharacterized protein n=1 Tax=Lactuca saligna TaxID=75948 RepID=A0AA35YW28_LACSI|nr:unnamed protein product [Lactuca saligna]